MDIIHAITKWFDHNRNLFLSLIVAGLVCTYVIGCTPTTASLADPAAQVTAEQLGREIAAAEFTHASERAKIDAAIAQFNAAVEAHNAQVNLAVDDLERQYEQRAKIIEFAGGLATSAATGAINPVSAIGSVVTLVGLFGFGGAKLDNMRKDRVIAQRDAMLAGKGA